MENLYVDIRAQRVKTHSNPCLFGDELIIIIIIIIIIIYKNLFIDLKK